MAIPIGHIVEPRWTKPLFISQNEVFPIVVDYAIITGIEAEMSCKKLSYPLVVLNKKPVRIVTFTDNIPGTLISVCPEKKIPPGLYSVTVKHEKNIDSARSCICVKPDAIENFKFAHISDPHIGLLSHEQEQKHLIAIKKLADFLNRQDILFTVVTGDLITRYSQKNGMLPYKKVSLAVEHAQDVLSGLHMPVIVTPGNHDIALPSNRKAWTLYMGRPWNRQTEDYSFEIGNTHFAVVEGFGFADPLTNKVYTHAFTKAQKEWLADDLKKSNAKLRFVITHYDYKDQLMPILKEHKVNVFIFGHKTGAEKNCRIFFVKGDRFGSKLIDWWALTGYKP